MSMRFFLSNRAGSAFFRKCLCLSAVLALAGLFFFPDHSGAAATPKGGNTRIIAEKMTYESTKNRVIFEGAVHVTRPDMQIWSEILTLILDNSGGKTSSGTGGDNPLGMEGGKVERIIAEKNVRIKQDDKTGTCGRATYYVTNAKIVMEQNPVLIDGDNRIKGRVINYYPDSGRSEVIGNVDVQFTTTSDAPPATPDSGSEEKAAP